MPRVSGSCEQPSYRLLRGLWTCGGIKRLRIRLKMSQAVLARCLNVSTKLVQAWEAGRRTPDGPALLLVMLVEKNPALVLSSWILVKPGRARAKQAPRSVKGCAGLGNWHDQAPDFGEATLLSPRQELRINQLEPVARNPTRQERTMMP